MLFPLDTSTKPISKKEACDLLNIAYNTNRLEKILSEHEENKSYTAKRKKAVRGTKAADHEIRGAVTEYLGGDSISTIAKGLYRSPAFVKSLLARVGVPTKPTTIEERLAFAYLPEACVAESFEKDDIVWSAKYHAPAYIKEEISVSYQAEKMGYEDTNYEKKYGSKCYAIYVLQAMEQDIDMVVPNVGGFCAYSLAYDLGSLKHLENYGIDLSKI
jgi:hypothetical protein